MALIWFRSDLRLTDNEALDLAIQNHSSVLGLFIVSIGEWSHHSLSGVKVHLMMRQLETLKLNLEKLHIPLTVRVALTRSQVPQIVLETIRDSGATHLYYNREHEVNESRRDSLIKSQLTIPIVEGESQLILPNVHLVKSGSDTPYTIFTPYKKKWISIMASRKNELEPRPAPSKILEPTGAFLKYAAKYSDFPMDIIHREFPVSEPLLKSTMETWPAGEDLIESKLSEFLTRASQYKDTRDIPSLDGTSKLSPYLAIGALSPKTCMYRALLQNNGSFDSGSIGLTTWMSELLWREFYRYLLIHFPRRTCMNKAFKPDADNVEWNYDEKVFDLWKQGKTGFPIVDAGMRQLNETGWMHNRLRMAMFLTKDLLIDWRWGEKYFMEHLIDGDFASNNGGWQWAASTGTDSQPYFRVFNPTLQSEKFDKDGLFIKKFLPELKTLRAKDVHEPSKVKSVKELSLMGYTAPIVNHAQARIRCIEVFKRALTK